MCRRCEQDRHRGRRNYDNRKHRNNNKKTHCLNYDDCPVVKTIIEKHIDLTVPIVEGLCEFERWVRKSNWFDYSNKKRRH